MAELTDDPDYNSGETFENVPSPLSYADNYDNYYGRRLRTSGLSAILQRKLPHDQATATTAAAPVPGGLGIPSILRVSGLLLPRRHQPVSSSATRLPELGEAALADEASESSTSSGMQAPDS
ncbi:unnamed protein product [Protopolystoma xenopodis]|uniref:Uncharacterized protein n=1 Tax=Protopolystoma xenopodis TaxID=117903 RepID=A0A3S5AMT6_9PLAT|nr:unnamed protein product [Protopolystoma xenopodis]